MLPRARGIGGGGSGAVKAPSWLASSSPMPAAGGAGAMQNKTPPPPPAKDDDEKAASGACERYQLDMAAARFGDCICGFPKAAHSRESLKAGSKPGMPSAAGGGLPSFFLNKQAESRRRSSSLIAGMRWALCAHAISDGGGGERALML